VGASRASAATNALRVEALQKAAALIQQQKSFKVAIDVEGAMESPGQKRPVRMGTFALRVSRPGRLALRQQGNASGVTIVADGQRLWRGAAAFKKFVVSDVPASLDEIFYQPEAGMMLIGTGLPFFRGLLSDQPYEEWMYDVVAVPNMQGEILDGRRCEHVVLSVRDLPDTSTSWHIWIDAGKSPLIRQASIEQAAPEESVDKHSARSTMSLFYRFHDWELDPKFSGDAFVFEPPSDWEKVDSILPRIAPRDFANRPGSLTKVGDVAPDVRIAPLEGEELDLTDLRGRVVLINFFATWCGPCRAEMPDLEKLWNEFGEHDQFRMYVIAREESADIVREFNETRRFTFPLAADPDRVAFAGFAEESIPRTYLIDREGKIIYQCTGYDFEKRERKKLRALLKQELAKPD
jgi:peroxiredoxin